VPEDLVFLSLELPIQGAVAHRKARIGATHVYNKLQAPIAAARVFSLVTFGNPTSNGFFANRRRLSPLSGAVFATESKPTPGGRRTIAG
jgi:hypothetical protein